MASGSITGESQSDQTSARDQSVGSTPLNITEPSGHIVNQSSGSENALFEFCSLEDDYVGLHMIDFNAPDLNNLDDSDLFPFCASATKTLGPATSAFPDPGNTKHLEYIPDPFLSMLPTYNTRSFIRRPVTRSGARNTTMLMTHILNSYPTMMRDHGSLPPFIHPHSLANVQDHNGKSFEALTTCMSIMQMFGSKMHGSRKLAWRNVRLECERISGEVRRAQLPYDGTHGMLTRISVGWV
jgi:hypothetical protein